MDPINNKKHIKSFKVEDVLLISLKFRVLKFNRIITILAIKPISATRLTIKALIAALLADFLVL
jgi:hypothetical protein